MKFLFLMTSSVREVVNCETFVKNTVSVSHQIFSYRGLVCIFYLEIKTVCLRGLFQCEVRVLF